MSQITDTRQMRSREDNTFLGIPFPADTVGRGIALVHLGFSVLTGLIGLRFLLKLMAANPANPFASLIYSITSPFLWMFQGLTRTPSFEGIEIEFYSLIAIAVYGMLGWVITQLIRILFAKR